MTLMSRVTLPEWKALAAHYQQIKAQNMRDWFAQDSQRFAHFSLSFADLLFDFSKNRITVETLDLLSQLAYAVNLPARIEDLFTAEPVNHTEQRPALHMALRNPQKAPLWVKEQNVMPLVHEALDKMADFVDAVRSGSWRGSTGKPIRDVVNIGIGGSHLGPLMTTQALAAFADSQLRFHFISDVDGQALREVWQQLDAERTLFIVSSKSFTTLETRMNAQSCRDWLQDCLQDKNLKPHFVAVTAQSEKAKQWGIPEEQIFPIWDWVGGRYSVWSAIGLPLALQIGMDSFQAFLEGAYEADLHFRTAEFKQNIPVMMGLLSVWYVNFFESPTHAIIPYAHCLRNLRAYIQQLDMESNGKRITRQGSEADYATGPIVWGELGIHGQHAFHQLLHQGTHLVPVDFILVGQQEAGLDRHQDLLVANALSQARALMCGKMEKDKHKDIPGNRPSSIFFMNKLSPKNLGAILAFYEHKIFVQSVVWDLNPFDQWGVELGKAILPDVMQDMEREALASQHDSSTQNLILLYKNLRST